MERLISIIVPVYNAENYLDRCIKSVVQQTYWNLELILIDDGSYDDSSEICSCWISKDDRIKYYHQYNSGVSLARNLGMKYAKGEYVAFVDADDFLDNSFCEKMIKHLEENDADIIFCERKNCYEDGKCTVTGFESHRLLMVPSSKYEYYGNYERRSVWGAVFKSKILKGQYFSELLAVGEDALYLIQAIQKSKMLVYFDEPLYNYTIQNESAYFGKFTERKFTEIQAWIQICDAIKNDGITKKSAIARCALVAKEMLKRYIGCSNFKKIYIDTLILIYRKNLLQVIRYDEIKKCGLTKKAKHIIFGICPHIIVEYWKKENEKKYRNSNTV